MKKIQFQDKEALMVYQGYISRVRKMVAELSADAQADILSEFNCHIYQELSNKGSQSEYLTMVGLVEKLGHPEIVLIPRVAEKRIVAFKQPIPSGVVVNTSMFFAASFYLLLSLLYLCIFILIFLAIAKIFLPQKVGFWYSDAGFKGFWLSHSADVDSNVREVLHFWLIPFFSIIAYALHSIIRFIKTKKSNFLNNLSLQTINT